MYLALTFYKTRTHLGKIDQLVKCFPCKHTDLGLVSSMQVAEVSACWCSCESPAPGRKRRPGTWGLLASQCSLLRKF